MLETSCFTLHIHSQTPLKKTFGTPWPSSISSFKKNNLWLSYPSKRFILKKMLKPPSFFFGLELVNLLAFSEGEKAWTRTHPPYRSVRWCLDCHHEKVMFSVRLESRNQISSNLKHLFLAILCDPFEMVKWPFSMVKWPPTRGWKGHIESPGSFSSVMRVYM